MSLHLGQVEVRLCGARLDVCDEHERPAGSKLNAGAGSQFGRLHDSLAVNEGTVAGVGVNEQAAAVLDAKLRMTTRDHRPF